jgi:cyclophilin family peptidyl-prolyl cis-trans isomerase
MAAPRLFALAAFTLLLVLPAAAATDPPGIVTGVEATLTDLPDGQNGDLWRIEYTLTGDFAYGTGHLLTISLPHPSSVFPQVINYAACGWSGAFLFADAGLLSEKGLDQLANGAVCPGGVPSLDLGGLDFVWDGASPTPQDTHRLVVYDPSYQVLETRMIAVPEPAAAWLSSVAIAVLFGLARRDRRRRSHRGASAIANRGSRLVVCALCLVLHAPPASLAAEPVEGTITVTLGVGGYTFTLQPVEFERAGRYVYRYIFDVTVESNLPTATGPALAHFGSGADFNSFSDALISIPALAAGEIRALDSIELSINRRQLDQFKGVGGGFFNDSMIGACVMPEPTLGMQLPESDPAIALLDEFTTSCGFIDKNVPNWRDLVPQPPKVAFTPGRTYTWILQTNLGALEFNLLPATAPHHVAALIYLSRLGFYDGLDFHRVIQDFVAQGGDPAGDGTGGPDYSLAGEFDPSESHDGRGVLSTANSGPVTDGSQIFITFAAATHLDGLHTITGRLVQGDAVLDAIELLPQPPTCSGSCPPTAPITIQSSSIVVAEPF